tara:strand:+ start:2851 stop:3177 length:327 start_codon:yes stop_codon:yes gene_type:complete
MIGMNDEDWEYRPTRDDRLKWLMKISNEPTGWWTLVNTNTSVTKCIEIKHREIKRNTWERVVVTGRFANHPNAYDEQKLRVKQTGPYNVWALNKPFTSQKIINYNGDV